VLAIRFHPDDVAVRKARSFSVGGSFPPGFASWQVSGVKECGYSVWFFAIRMACGCEGGMA
jgi:hypothetical protein